MIYQSSRNSYFNYALAIALLLHGLIILGVTFQSINSTNTNQQLEVTLSSSASDEAPEQADFIAASNQIGSGTEEQSAQLSNTDVALFNDNKVKDISPLSLPEQQQAVILEQPYRIITTTGDVFFKVPLNEHYELLRELNEITLDGTEDIERISYEIASLEARLADRQQAFAKGPRVLRLTSASTKASPDAQYIHQWRERIEAVGNLHYPQEAKDKELYGDVRLLVAINANGVVESINILQGSGVDLLDRAAIESIWLASPFEPFSKRLADNYDRIEIIRTWQFRKGRLNAN